MSGGFFIDDGNVTLFSPLDAVRTFARGINDRGVIVGDWTGPDGVNRRIHP